MIATYSQLVPQRIVTVWQFVRPFTMLAPGVGFFSASLMAIGRAQLTPHGGVWSLIGLGALAAALLNAASNALNQVYDLEIDRINKPRRPLPAGRMTRRQGTWISLGLYACALILALFLPPVTFAMFALAALATVLYSVPPVRAKARGIWANVCIAIPRGTLLKVAGWSAVTGALTPEPWLVGLIFGLFLFGATTTKDLGDVEGDREYDCATLPVVYGPRRATLMVAPFFVLPWLLIPLGAFVGILKINRALAVVIGISLAALGAYLVALMYRHARRGAAANAQAPWVLMYGLLMAAQTSLAAAYLIS